MWKSARMRLEFLVVVARRSGLGRDVLLSCVSRCRWLLSSVPGLSRPDRLLRRLRDTHARPATADAAGVPLGDGGGRRRSPGGSTRFPTPRRPDPLAEDGRRRSREHALVGVLNRPGTD